MTRILLQTTISKAAGTPACRASGRLCGSPGAGRRRVEKPPELRVSLYGSADVRKGLKQFDVVEKVIRELLRCLGILLPRPLENLFQIG